MGFKFTEEQLMLRDAFAQFAKEKIAPHAAKWDEQNHVPMDIVPKLGKMGILGIFVPKQYGGTGLGHVERCIALEEISRYSAGLAMMVFTHQLGLSAILDYGTEEQKQKWLPGMCDGSSVCGLAVTEPSGGSDIAGLKTEATADGDNWIINGRKCFITNSHCAKVAVITCKTGEDEKGRPLMTTIAIEKGTEGFMPGREENKMGLRGSFTGELIMNNAKVPMASTIGEIDKGMPITMKELSEIGRASMSAIELGILRACLEDAVTFSKEKILYGKPISKLQAIQFKIADIRCDYEAANLMTYNAATMKDEGALSNEFSMTKYFISEAAVRAAKNLIEIMGGYGVVNEYAAGRYLRDAMGCIPSCGTSEVQKIIIAGDTLKKFAPETTRIKQDGERLLQTLEADTPKEAAKAILDIVKTNGDESHEKILLCGGFGIGSAEYGEKLRILADKLGAKYGCTRPALDADWGFEESYMIGSSGCKVNPGIYIGFGVSGANHHTCGIKASNLIVNINNDEGADIFAISDYKAVFDAREVIDELLKQLG